MHLLDILDSCKIPQDVFLLTQFKFLGYILHAFSSSTVYPQIIFFCENQYLIWVKRSKLLAIVTIHILAYTRYPWSVSVMYFSRLLQFDKLINDFQVSY